MPHVKSTIRIIKELEIEPIEFAVRSQIGKEIEAREVGSIRLVIDELTRSRDAYRKQIIHLRTAYISNWLNSSRVGGDYLIGCYTEPAVPITTNKEI